jgi:hypothetical protein
MKLTTGQFLAIVPALLLAACGEMRWTKPGGSDADVNADLANCRAAAHSSIERTLGPRLPQTSQGRMGNAPVDPTPADRQMQEAQAVNRCMQEKGYQLVPVDK